MSQPQDKPREFEGACHCGGIGFVFRTAVDPAHWRIRQCQCTFCRSHGARTTSDPAGAVSLRIANPACDTRYRFASRSADFLVCSNCGVYLAAVLTTPEGRFATLNVNTIADIPEAAQAIPVSYAGETVEHKQARRAANWTPVSDIS